MNFSDFIDLNEAKNTHMTHIEDRVIYGGVNGTREAIFALRDLRDMLGGVKDGSVSVKWDGAPAIFCGTDPSDGKFFVAKKGIFNKNPKIYKTNKDIDDDSDGALNKKLKLALQYLPDLGIKGVIQGDFLYGPGDLSKQKIKGKKYITFHPNTIVYAVPDDTPSATEIKRAKIGIVWHTTYTGNSFESMRASYGVDVKRLRKSPNVWSQDAMLKNVMSATMNKKDTDMVNEYLSEIGRVFNRIAGSTLRQLEANKDLAQHIEQHSNTFVRAGQIPPDPKRRVTALMRFIDTKYKKEIASRKTSKGKAGQQKKLDALLDFFSPRNRSSLEQMFDLQRLIVLVKLKLINILNRLNKLDTFVKTRNGFKTTGQEGYVAIDRLGGDAVKIVDRLEFSYNNFSPNVLKGWDKAGR
tara:strand:+ start:1934 stop:3163 length:1230 start_codon:yes stop_codon:yes gene_type:complete